MAAGPLQAYRYVRVQRQVGMDARTTEPSRTASTRSDGTFRALRLRQKIQAVLRRGDGELNFNSRARLEHQKAR